MSAGLRRSFASLSVPNYRRYFTGQVVSIAGNWMEVVAEAWLVLRLTDSGVALGFASALQFLPVLLLGAYGGLIADRVDKRTLLRVTQTAMMAPALALWLLTATGAIELWMVYALVLVRGTVNAVDNPARQSFVSEMVGREAVVNAVSLNSVVVQSARLVGPAIAAAVIATVGVSTCYALNAATFAVMLVALQRMDPAALHPPARRAASHQRGQIREALALVARTPELRTPLVIIAIVGTLAFNFRVVVPLVAQRAFDGDATTYALLTGAMGVGAIVGALVQGARSRTTPRLVALSSIAFGVFLAVATVVPTLSLELLAFVGVGYASVTLTASANAALQLAVAPELRGRVMALYSVVFLGSTPIGSPIVGWLSQAVGPRAGLGVGAVAALATGIWALAATRRDGGERYPHRPLRARRAWLLRRGRRAALIEP